MNYYDGVRYRVESTVCEWSGPWESLGDAERRMDGLATDYYVVVDESGMCVWSKQRGLMMPYPDYHARRGAK